MFWVGFIKLARARSTSFFLKRPPHAATTQRACDYLKARLINLAHVRMQLPITLSASEPEPNIAIVKIDPGAYANHHPAASEIFLLIEVAHTSLNIDRQEKAPIYAKANIVEYWILDIIERRVYTFCKPSNQSYQEETILNQDAVLAPLAFPDIKIPCSELFLA